MKTKTLVLAACATGLIISGGVYLTQDSKTGALEAPDPVPELGSVIKSPPVAPEPVITVTVLSGDIVPSEVNTSTPIGGVTSTPIN